MRRSWGSQVMTMATLCSTSLLRMTSLRKLTKCTLSWPALATPSISRVALQYP